MVDSKTLATNRADVIAAVCRGVAGAAPYLGSLAAEAISIAIPSQKLDRVVQFVVDLDRRVTDLHVSMEELQRSWKSPEFLDLFEDALLQASRALSEARRAQLASILANGLSEDTLNHSSIKKMLRILDSLTDEEVVVLEYTSLKGDDAKRFLDTHRELLTQPSAQIGAPQHEMDRRALLASYTQSLISLGLVEHTMLSDHRIPTLRTTGTGLLLLRYLHTERTPSA